MSNNDLLQIASTFCSPLEVLSVQELGRGNINDTYLIETAEKRFVLQRINGRVFAEPEQVVTNIHRVTHHFISAEKHTASRWQNTTLLRTDSEKFLYRDRENHIWRCLSFIENSYSCDVISSPEQGYEVGWALGCFHRMSADLDPNSLYETIPGFHVLPQYLAEYDRIIPLPLKINSPEARYCIQCINKYRSQAHILEQCKKTGQLPSRVIHGDPKVANVLFNNESGQAVSLIDLDTVGPGLLHYDLGDCLRSCCNAGGEEGENGAVVDFETDICNQVMTGYFSEATGLLSADQKKLIFEAVKLITFELAIRFFTDHLREDQYFKVSYEGENLLRSVNQFHLMESIINREKSIRLILES